MATRDLDVELEDEPERCNTVVASVQDWAATLIGGTFVWDAAKGRHVRENASNNVWGIERSIWEDESGVLRMGNKSLEHVMLTCDGKLTMADTAAVTCTEYGRDGAYPITFACQD